MPRLSGRAAATAAGVAVLFGAGAAAGALIGGGESATETPATLQAAGAPATQPLPKIAAEGRVPALRAEPVTSTPTVTGTGGDTDTGTDPPSPPSPQPPSPQPPPPSPPGPRPPSPPDDPCPDGC